METRKKKSFKRLFAFLMAFVMVTTLAVSAVFAADPTFKDVPKDYEFYDEIEDLAAKKIVSGYGDTGLFKPEEKLTRAQAAKMIAKAAGIKVSKGFKSSFTDVDEDVDMYEHIWALEEAEIVKGWGTTKEFRPDEAIERGHVAKMIALAFGIVDGSKKVEFKDLPADKDVADAIMALATNDIVKGYGTTGEFKPEEPVLRGQFSKMVSRAMNLKFEILDVRAISAKTVEATFNKEPSALALKDFSVYEKDDESAINVITKLAKKGAVATLTLTNALEEDTDYILDVDGVGKAEFTYEEAEAASIAFVATTVQTTKDVLYMIKDADGNDITANYSLADLTVQTSAPSVVSNVLKAGDVGYSVVNVKITGTEIETGNTVIEVKSSLDVLTSVGRWTLIIGDSGVGTLAKPVTELFESTGDARFEAEALNQHGKVNDPAATITYKSNSPKVLVVQPDGQAVEPISPGTASVVITATLDKKSVSKTVQVTVKADPKATTLELEPKSVTLVKGSGLTQVVNAKVLDQYGKKISITAGITHEFAKNGIAAITHAYSEGISKTTFTPVDKGSTTLKFTYEDGTIKLTESVTVTVVEPGAFAGYKVETDDLILDKLDENNPVDGDLAKGPLSTVVRVFRVDAGGNKISELNSGEFGLAYVGTETAKAVQFSGATVSAKAAGTQKLNVLVGTTLIDTLTFTVYDSIRALDNVVQLKNALTVAVGGEIKLFSANTTTDEAFVGYDQHGDKFVVTGEYTIASSDVSVVSTGLTASKAGTAKLTIVFGELDLIFTIDIVVTAP